MRILVGGLCAALLATAIGSRALDAAASCDSLAAMALPHTTITLATVVEAGAFTPPAAAGANPAAAAGPMLRGLPAFCRVAVTLRPSSDSDIKVEVWLPLSGWNGKFQAVGNGGWAGTIGYNNLAEAVTRGYVASGTDTGHTGNSASFALGHPEKLIDYAYRSEHAMAVASKAVLQA